MQDNQTNGQGQNHAQEQGPPVELTPQEIEAAVKAAETDLNKMPRPAKLLLLLQNIGQNLLGEIAEEARAAGRLDAKGQPVITPDEIRRDLVVPLLSFLAGDVQSLGVVDLEWLSNMLVFLWTLPENPGEEDTQETGG